MRCVSSYTWEFKQNQDLTINQIPISRPASKVETFCERAGLRSL
ncbi:MAG: hypothetical protein AAF378_04865 [Cyanobacteria bacterium P01_A01_bin.84]